MIKHEDDSKLVEKLYHNLINSWNTRNAEEFADCFSLEGSSIGFDGSEAKGKEEIANHLKEVFQNHQTAKYITIINQIRFVSDEVCILQASVGMIPPGKIDINPAVNTVQTIVAKREENLWVIEQLQNTPAAYHGRPELSDRFSAELRKALKEEEIL